MCGIAGEIVFNGHPLHSLTSWSRLVDRMWRRGPDSSGVWTDHHTAVLGCCRLAVMDTAERANLPIRSEDGRFVLAYNGEIYQSGNLEKELRRRGWQFRTRSDAEVVLASLAEFGVDALEKFNGIFALALFDARERRLTLARDHAGIKPLYVLHHRQGAIFGSELELLLDTGPGREQPVDPDAMAMYLRLGHVPAPRTMLRDVSMLEPGTWQSYSADGQIKKGRHFTFPLETDRKIKRCDAEPAIEAALSSAIRRQLVCDVPVGCFLSGGIDSPLIAAIGARELDRPLDTFSIATDDAAFDESVEAERYAAAIGSRHHVITMTESNAQQLLTQTVAAMREPMADEGMLPTLLVSQAARERVTVALSGEGGDELFFGYVARQCAMLGAPAPTDRNDCYARNLNDFPRELFERCFPETPWWPSGATVSGLELAPDEWVDWLRHAEFCGYLPYILLKTDRASMFHSLEVRVPYLDREVIDVALSIDPEVMIDPAAGIGKKPLRAILRRLTGIETAGKRGFSVPVDDWIRGPLRDGVMTSLDRLAGLDDFPINRRALRQVVRDHMEGRGDAGTVIWRLLVLDLWWNRCREANR